MTGARDSSYRLLSLAAVCLQSTALAIILHVSQAHLKAGQVQYKASSAVLITEVGKLVLSLLLALRDAWKERATLHAPRHTLPSPELYAAADEVHQKDLYADDPFDTKPTLTVNGQVPGSFPTSNNLRRRSSAMAPDTLSVQMDGGKGGRTKKFPENSTLNAFQWPRVALSPVLQEKDGSLPGSPEMVKLLTDPVLWTRRRRMGLRAMLWEDIFGSDWWKMGIPAVLFAVQNNLIYVAARNLSVPVFQITFQLKTLITAICAVAMLGRRLTVTQWFSLVLLGAGVATMQLGAIHAKAGDSHDHGPVPVTETASYLTGISAVLISCFSSAIAATYFELVIKKKPVVPEVQEFMLVAPPDIKPASLWVRNIQLSLFSTLFGIVVVIVQANPGHLMGYGGLSLDFKGMIDPLEHWYDPVMTAAQGFFDGFHPMVWFVIALQTVGGLLIALAIKYADNVAKGFALSISIVFTFLLSVILFDFHLSASSILGGMAVVSSTLLYEADDKFLRQLIRPDPYSQSKPILRRWHYFLLVILATTFGVAIFPSRHLSVTDAAWDLVAPHNMHHSLGHLPTIAVADMGSINALLTKAAGVGEGMCGWGLSPNRWSTKAPFGGDHPVSSDFPYLVTNTNQYALDDILTTRMIDYARNVPLLGSPSPDFIYLPVLSQIWSNPWGCGSPTLHEGIKQTTEYIRQIAASIGKTPYPRLILPVAGIRSNLEASVLTTEFMEELKDSLVVVSIETAPKSLPEGLKYLIDVPYPTSFHLSLGNAGTKPEVGSYWLNQNRPYLLHYAAAASHPWGLPATDPFNGFALRNVLHKEFTEYTKNPRADATSQIMFDDITNSFDGAQNLTAFHEHMSQSIFCPMPAGDSPSRRAIYEAMLLGCIPVIFREKSYGRLFPSSPEINDMSRYTVFVDEDEMLSGAGGSLISRLERITPREIHRMQRHLAKIASKLQWSVPEEDVYFPLSAHSQNASPLPAGVPVYNHTRSIEEQAKQVPVVDAFHLFLKELETIRSGEWVAGNAVFHRKGRKAKSFGRQGQR